MSPNIYSVDAQEVLTSSKVSDGLAAQEKRHLIENFLKNEQVFQILYDTVFSSPTEKTQAKEAGILKTNSYGQADFDGNELSRTYVRRVTNENEKLFEAVVAGTKSGLKKNNGHKRN